MKQVIAESIGSPARLRGSCEPSSVCVPGTEPGSTTLSSFLSPELKGFDLEFLLWVINLTLGIPCYAFEWLYTHNSE